MMCPVNNTEECQENCDFKDEKGQCDLKLICKTIINKLNTLSYKLKESSENSS